MGVRVTSVAGKLGGGGGTKDASRRLGSILGHRDPHTGGSPPDRVPLSPSSTHHETLTPPPPRGSGPPNPLPLFPNPPPQPKRNPGIRVLPPNSPGTPQKEQGNTPPPPQPQGYPKTMWAEHGAQHVRPGESLLHP